MEFYRETFPNAPVFPKLHLLECHAMQQVNATQMGLGFLGEHGIEVIHHHFNISERTYSSMANDLEKLKCMVKDHHIRTHPGNPRPTSVKRKRGMHEE